MEGEPQDPIPIYQFFPQEGTEVLAWNGKVWTICLFSQSHRFLDGYEEVLGVTHWLPLPEPPQP